MTDRAVLRSEAHALLRIAAPVVVAEIGWMCMGLVDSIMVGPLGPEAIAATGLGGGVFTAIVIFGMSLLLGLDTLVSQAFGAGRRDECERLLYQGFGLAMLSTPVILAVAGLVYLSMDAWDLNPQIDVLMRPYFAWVTLSTVPLLFYAALRRYLQGIHVVRPIMITLITANIINIVANYLLIYGHFGFPALGVRGSALATTIARTYMAVMLWLAVVQARRAGPTPMVVRFGIDPARIRRLLNLGLPAAIQVTLEVGAFALATALAARLDAVSSASHQIALNVAGLAYMVPLGLCSAAAVRVGHAIGALDRERAIGAGWLAISLAAVLAISMAVILLAVPGPILGVFTRDVRVLEIGGLLLGIAAAFQLFDSLQTVAIGALRGLGDTVAPMVINLIVHWVIGLPIGYVLCFRLGWGVTGIWIGFSTGLIVAAIVLLVVWMRRTRMLVMPSTFAGAQAE